MDSSAWRCTPSWTFSEAATPPWRQAGWRYTGTAIPGWDNSLLVLSLLRGAVFRVPLRADGRAVNGAPLAYFKSTNRYRDIALHPDGRRFHLVTDSEGRTTDDTGALTRTVANPGAVIEYTFTSSR